MTSGASVSAFRSVTVLSGSEPGSSGSPVLNNSWDLVALHHAAGSQDGTGDWLDNQGVRIDKFVADLRSQLSGSTAGQAVLSELGI